MFGCIVAGRLIQTNLQQVDVNKFIFEIPNAAVINHIVVFLLGTIPFEPGYAATVHFLWPGAEGWKLLGMLSNEKPSAIFRLRGLIIPTTKEDISMDMNDTAEPSPQATATVGISVEPITAVQAQMSSLTTTTITTTTSTNLVTTTTPDNIIQVTTNILKNLYNYVTSFATSSLPLGAQVIGDARTQQSYYVQVKAFQDWYDGFMRKIKNDPGLVLRGDENSRRG